MDLGVEMIPQPPNESLHGLESSSSIPKDFLEKKHGEKNHGVSAGPKRLCCFYVSVSGSTKVGKDAGGAAYKNTLEVSMHAGLLTLLDLEKHLVIRLKQLNWVL